MHVSVMTVGFALRIPMTIYPNSLPIYLCSSLFILLSPATFLAFDYILYGRFVVNCIPRRHSLIRPERTARYFVISDVATFLVQACIPLFYYFSCSLIHTLNTGHRRFFPDFNGRQHRQDRDLHRHWRPCAPDIILFNIHPPRLSRLPEPEARRHQTVWGTVGHDPEDALLHVSLFPCSFVFPLQIGLRSNS